MSECESMKYIKLIIEGLKYEPKFLSEIDKTELKELEIDIFSEELYQKLYKNMLYFLTIKSPIKLEEQKYFHSEIINLLRIIYESKPRYFFEKDIVKSMIIFAVYYIKDPIIMNLEFILKIFLSNEKVVKYIPNNLIENDILKFEASLIPTIKSLISKYEADYEKQIKISNKNPNLRDIIEDLENYVSDDNTLPFYLQGFIKYENQSNHKKYLIIKIYKYLEMINPYKNVPIRFNLFQGYALFGIFSYKYNQINFNEFFNIKVNRITNDNAKNILKSAIQFLEAKNITNFNDKIACENFETGLNPPKVIDIFDNTDEYYKDLYSKLKYFLLQYKSSSNLCEIITNEFSRVIWFNFCKILLINLKEEDIKRNDIKIIFFLIVNLFNPNTDKGSLEFRNDAISMLFSQCKFSNEISDYQEIYRLIDKDYSIYYPKLEKYNNFNQSLINWENEKALNNNEISENLKKNQEIINLEKYNKNLPFPLLKEFLIILKWQTSKDTLSSQNLNDFYRNCFNDLEDNSKKDFINIIKDAKTPGNKEYKKISDLINDKNFLDLVINIMKSRVMYKAYKIIYKLYSTNGNYDFNNEIEDLDDESENSISQENLINGHPLTYYYKIFCNSITNLLYSNRFIIMALPEEIKGFTFRFLKIVINSEGANIQSNNKTISENDKQILLKAYLIFIIIHELNHFIKRLLNIGQDIDVCKTPKIKGFDDEGEGGKQLIKLLFGDVLINKYLNIEQSKYILDIKNWNKARVREFREDFSKIETNKGNEGSIVYFNSDKMSICDHSKLFA